jgi:hypothetical protein
MPKPNFSGNRKFNRIKSALQIPTPESSNFIISHQEPLFRLKRILVFEG